MADEAQQGVTQEPVAEVQAPEPVQTQQASKEMNFEALREKVDALKQQNDFLQMQLMERQTPQKQPQQDSIDLNQFRDDDIPTYGELKKILQKEERQRAKYLEKIKDLEMRSEHNDYADVVREYLPDVLQEDPDLAIAIKDNPMMHKLAYRLAQASPKYHEKRLAKQNEASLNRIVENTTRAQPANVRKNISVQDEEARMASMSDQQLMDMFNMAKARS